LVIGTGNLEIARLVNPWLGGGEWVLAAALYASVPVTGAVLALLPKTATTPPATRPGRWCQTAQLGQARVVLAFLLGGAAVWTTFDRRQKLLAEMDYDANCGRYEAVLAAARQVKVLDHPAKVRLLLALYHTGRLAEDLFSFHDMVEQAPLEGFGKDCRAQSQPLFELGLVNDAEHMAHEALELEGNRPDLLRLLARINLLKDRPEAAQVFLNVLSLIPFQGERANEAWPTMDPEMPTAERAFLAQMRARVLTNDVLHDGLPMGRLLDVVLASNPTNQMAFEYLMAYDMLDLDLKQAVGHLRLLDNFNYARIPRPYEEAILLFQQLAGVKVELKGRTIRPETAERYRQFGDAAGQLGESAEGQAAIAASFGDTYWYYYFAARSRVRAAEGQASGP
jgi:tetratricopeptide (TPR) repeat protein